jgi:hypothetical protein
MVQGRVCTLNHIVLQHVSVVVTDSMNNVIDYTFTDKNGIYKLEIEAIGKFSLSFSHIGHETNILNIQLYETKKIYNVDVTLKNKSILLNEVIIQAERPVLIKKDTISFKTKYFTDGINQTVEDLLKKIPGLQVDSEGTVKVGNQEIEKLMIDGDDFLGKGYKILSKNMPAYPIVEVEVLKNYSNNRLLKGIEESDKVTLNLKLDEKSKRIWFGNVDLGYGNSNFYEAKSNLMNFGKTNKYYLFSNLNSIGYDATGNVQDLIHPSHFNEPANIGDDQQVYDLLSLSASNPSFKRNHTNFNNNKMVSLNAIFNPTKKLKIKTLGFFNCDGIDFFQNTKNMVNVSGISFTNTEDYTFSSKKSIAFGKLDITHDFSKSEMLEAIVKYNNGNFKDGSNLVFNNNTTLENLQHQNTLFDQKINYTNKFTDKKVFLVTWRFIDEKTPQNYNINHFFYENLFSRSTNANKVRQYSKNQIQFAGINVHLMSRKQNDDLLEIQLGNEYKKDKLATIFSLLEEEAILSEPRDYQNQTIYQVNDLYLKGKYRYKLDNNIGITGKLEFHQLFNSLKNNEIIENQSPFFINPSIDFEWKINDKNKLVSSYSYNSINAKILDVYSNFVLTGFRSFSKGTGSFNQLNTSSVLLNYQLGNWLDRFFTNTFLIYNKNHDFFSTNTSIGQNYTKSEKILIKDRDFLIISSNLDYYLRNISSNLKLDLTYSKSEFKNVVNNSNLREVTSNNYAYGLELRSVFKGIFNYHVGTKWTTSKIKTTIKNSLINTT